LFIPNLTGKSKEISDKRCDALLQVVQTQVESFYLDEGNFPEDLNALVTANYIKENQKQCSEEQKFDYDEKTGEVTL